MQVLLFRWEGWAGRAGCIAAMINYFGERRRKYEAGHGQCFNCVATLPHVGIAHLQAKT
jgi:hypothetical protein